MAATQISPGATAWVTWAYDGSGVELRYEAVVKAVEGERVRVARKSTGAVELVEAASVTPEGSYPRVASFGWLD